MPKREPPVLTLKEAADYLRVSRSTLYRLIRQGKLAVMKVGGQYRIDRDRLEAMVKASHRPL